MSSPVATQPSPPTPTTAVERPKKPLLSTLLTRPEVGSFAAAIAIFIFFSAIAEPFRSLPALSTVLYASSSIGIVAVGVALLMIGGEFDLSAGVSVVTGALTASMISYQLSANLWVGVFVSLVVMLAVGFFNGYLVVKTGIPSFLITLGSFFMLGGINLGVTKLVTGTVATQNVADMDGFASARAVFASEFAVGGVTIRVTVLWWIFFVALATWILLRTRLGNWIFAVGGNAASASASRSPAPPPSRVSS
jgi:simple sugar transport system permease protein